MEYSPIVCLNELVYARHGSTAPWPELIIVAEAILLVGLILREDCARCYERSCKYDGHKLAQSSSGQVILQQLHAIHERLVRKDQST